MVREQGPFKLSHPWSGIAWGTVAVVCVVSFLLGFLVLGRFQVDGPRLGTWDALCRAIGLSADLRPAGAPQPPLQTPTRIAWTQATLARIASGSEQHGAFVALNCTACHGEQGVSSSTLIPTLAGMNSAVIYKQLDDYRSGKRLCGHAERAS
jgi:cytochrome c553